MEITIDEETGHHVVYSSVFDYMAYGTTQEEALRHFELGLRGTISARVSMGLCPLPEPAADEKLEYKSKL